VNDSDRDRQAVARVAVLARIVRQFRIDRCGIVGHLDPVDGDRDAVDRLDLS
jgi:hypothetical protein